MAPINKKIRAAAMLTKSNKTSSSSSKSDTTIDPSNLDSSDSEPAEARSSSSANLKDEAYPKQSLSSEDHHPGQGSSDKRSSSVPFSISSQYGKMLHSSVHRDDHGSNRNYMPSPSSSPFDPSPHSHSLSFNFSSLSPSPSNNFNIDKTHRSTHSPSDVAHYRNAGNRHQNAISSGIGRCSPDTPNYKQSSKSSSSDQHQGSYHYNPFKPNPSSPSSSSSSPSSHQALAHDRSLSLGQSGNKVTLDKSSEEYRLRRERNNIAVRKSRSKSKVKFQQTIERMNQLETENSDLKQCIAQMNQEMAILKFLLNKYHPDNHKRLIKFDNLDSMDIPQETEMLNRVEIGNERFQIRNFGNSRSNINHFYPER